MRLEPLRGGGRQTTLYELAAVDTDQIGILFTKYADRSPAENIGSPEAVECIVENIPWERINIVHFRIDRDRTNAYWAWKALQAGAHKDAAQNLRARQELSIETPIISGLRIAAQSLTQAVRLPDFATVLLWITPFTEAVPTAPSPITIEISDGNVILRWNPSGSVDFYTYELFHKMPEQAAFEHISPLPLRSAMWVDTAPRNGIHVYAVRSVTASGISSELVETPPFRM
jgi:hypothetical protein